MRSRRVAEGVLRQILAAIPPASGAVVMGTGIVSIALSLDGHETLSRILLVVAACVWVALGTLLAARFARAWVWVALAVWLIAFAPMLRRGLQLVRGQHTPTGPDRIDEFAHGRHSPA